MINVADEVNQFGQFPNSIIMLNSLVQVTSSNTDQRHAYANWGPLTLKIDTATRPFLGLNDMRHSTFLKSTGRHEVFLNSTGRHYHYL